jgi:ABC-type thiamin/hydroxymethylpyrimidine transport system permease subunit
MNVTSDKFGSPVVANLPFYYIACASSSPDFFCISYFFYSTTFRLVYVMVTLLQILIVSNLLTMLLSLLI